jgi:hypothetical protein
MNIKALPDVKDYNTDLEESLVKRTTFLRKNYKGKVKPKTKPGTKRSITQGGGLTHLALVDTYNTIHGYKYNTKLLNQIGLNLMAKVDGSVLINREALYWLKENDVFTGGNGFAAIDVIERLKRIGVLEKHSEYKRHEGVAREGIVKPRRGLSKIAIEILSYYIDNTILNIIEDITFAYEVEDDEVYWPDDEVKQAVSQIIAQEYYQSLEQVTYRRKNTSLQVACFFKKYQDKLGMTPKFIKFITELICPGYQQARKEHIVRELCNKYEIIYSHQENAPLQQLELPLCKDSSIEDVVWSSPIKESNPNPRLEIEEEEESNPHDSPVMFPSVNTTILLDSPLIEATIEDLVTVEIENLSTLRNTASSLIVSHSSDIDHTYNDALSAGVISYLPKDTNDERQQSVMLSNGCLPFEYRLASPASPRVYSKQTDNLFYCRKDMRLSVMEGLGFVDVDLQNCHAEFALAMWGDQLPVLKEHMDKGSLWDYYKDYFFQHNLPFYKGFIKALHHATFLTGGQKAYSNAWQRYNNLHPDAIIQKTEYDAIIKVFIKCPVCLELKALFKLLRSKWVGKVLTCPTGESFLVKDTNWALFKKEGIDNGNFPTALAALLQSLEVSLLSYLIIRCQALFVPILWQHDGITIKALYSNTVELMQVAVNEFCEKYLRGNRYLKLTVEKL